MSLRSWCEWRDGDSRPSGRCRTRPALTDSFAKHRCTQLSLMGPPCCVMYSGFPSPRCSLRQVRLSRSYSQSCMAETASRSRNPVCLYAVLTRARTTGTGHLSRLQLRGSSVPMWAETWSNAV